MPDVVDTRDAEQKAGELVRRSPWLQRAARVGYASRGVMYFLVGGFALLAALGAGAPVTGLRGAMRRVLTHPAGIVLVVAMTAGFAAHALWCLLQAACDPERRARARAEGGETPARRIGYRLGRLFEALFHVALVAGAVGLVTGWNDRPDGRQSNLHQWAAWLIERRAGAWVVMAAGAGVVGFGIFEILRALRMKLDAMLALDRIDPAPRRVVVHVSRFGIAARGVVFALIGAWMAVAGWEANAADVKGVGGALDELGRHRAFGAWLLGLASAGWLAYGGYEVARAIWRRIGPKR